MLQLVTIHIYIALSLGRKVALAPENSPLTEALSVQDSTILRARDISVPAAEEPSVLSSLRQIGSSGIDVDMLRQRQDILFYDEIILYQVPLWKRGIACLEFG